MNRYTSLKSFLLWSFVVSTFFSCKSENPDLIISNIISDRKVLDYVVEDVEFKGDSLTLLYYQKNFFYQKNEESFFFGYNNTLHALDVFSLNEKVLVKRVFLDQEGPDFINRVFKIMILPNGFIVVMDGYKLWVLNEDGKAIKHYSLIVKMDGHITGHFLNYNDANLGYLPEEDAVILYFIHEDESSSNSDKRKSFPIIGKLKLDDGSITFFPIIYPLYVQINFDKVSEKMINLSYHNGLIFYGFPGHSNIYTYSVLENTFREVGGKSRFSSNEEDFLISNEHGDRLLGTWFNSVQYDPINRVYFRTHWGNQQLYQPDGSLSNAYSKPGYLMLFDRNLGYIDELIIPNEYWVEDSFIANGEIYFWKKDAYLIEENVLVLGKLTVSLN